MEDLNHHDMRFSYLPYMGKCTVNPHADAVELAFVLIYIYKQQMF